MVSLLSVIALGFFLGMRHATDPDHVIAVSTIVSRQANVRRAALVGTFWGIGHTLTIFVVGTLIILFDLVIPPRVGLSMELSVGVMLMILGLANVRSFLRSMPPEMSATALAHSHPHSHGDYVHSHSHGHDRAYRKQQAGLLTLGLRKGRTRPGQSAQPGSGHVRRIQSRCQELLRNFSSDSSDFPPRFELRGTAN